MAVNLLMSLVLLPRIDFSYLAEERWGATSISAVAGVWSVVVALAAAIVSVIFFNRGRLLALRQSMDAGANASVLSALSVASLVGFGAVIAALPAFAIVRDWVLGIQGGLLVSLAVATNVLAALTGSASGGLTIALDALGQNYMALAAQTGLRPALMHRVAVIGSGTLDILPHNGAVVTGGLRIDTPRKLLRYRYGWDCQRRSRLGRGYPARHSIWIILKALHSGVPIRFEKFAT